MARVVRARAQSAGRLRARHGAWCASSFQRRRHRWDAAARFVARGRDCPGHCNGKHARAASSTFIRPPRRATTTSRANSLGGGRRCCELVASEPARQLAREHGHHDTRRMDVFARRHGQDGGLDEVGERWLEHLAQIANIFLFGAVIVQRERTTRARARALPMHVIPPSQPSCSPLRASEMKRSEAPRAARRRRPVRSLLVAPRVRRGILPTMQCARGRAADETEAAAREALAARSEAAERGLAVERELHERVRRAERAGRWQRLGAVDPARRRGLEGSLNRRRVRVAVQLDGQRAHAVDLDAERHGSVRFFCCSPGSTIVSEYKAGQAGRQASEVHAAVAKARQAGCKQENQATSK